MTTTVTTTGTGTPIPHPDRAGAGTHVHYGDVHLQFDAGRMTVNRLTKMGLAPADLSAVFLTHYHSDHVVGLTDLLLTHWVLDWDDDRAALPVVAPNGPTTEFVDRMFTIWDNDLAVRSHHSGRPPQPKIDAIGFDVPDALTEVWSMGEVRVLAGQVRHEPVVGAVGYRVETPDGIVAITGDTRVCDEVADLAAGADVVVYEAMRLDAVLARRPSSRYIAEYYADTHQIGEQCQQLGIPAVMLTHLIPAPANPEERQLFEAEMRRGGYTGQVIVCDDLSSFQLSK